MTVPRYDILGVKVDAITIDDSISRIGEWIAQPNKSALSKVVVKPYVEFMTRAYADKETQELLNRADMCLPDGVSLQWGASLIYGEPDRKPNLWKLIKSSLIDIQNLRWRSKVLPEKFAGIDFTSRLLDVASEQSWRVGVIGGGRDIAHTKSALKQLWPKLDLVDVWSGYSRTTASMDFAGAGVDAEYDDIIRQIKSSELDILLVAMGFPRQELFMDANKRNLEVKVMIGEGGTFDYRQMGGSVRRAPKWMQKVGLEWLWRLILQPKRLKRQLAIPQYAWLVYSQARRRWSDMQPKK